MLAFCFWKLCRLLLCTYSTTVHVYMYGKVGFYSLWHLWANFRYLIRPTKKILLFRWKKIYHSPDRTACKYNIICKSFFSCSIDIKLQQNGWSFFCHPHFQKQKYFLVGLTPNANTLRVFCPFPRNIKIIDWPQKLVLWNFNIF